jgi:hypothetical protein
MAEEIADDLVFGSAGEEDQKQAEADAKGFRHDGVIPRKTAPGSARHPHGQPHNPAAPELSISVPNEDPAADAARNADRPEPLAPAADPEMVGKELSDEVQETSELHPDGKPEDSD